METGRIQYGIVRSDGIMARRTQQQAREYRQQIQKEITKANQRLDRLVKNDLQHSPAYQKLMKQRGHTLGIAKRFTMRGKSGHELQKELIQLRAFMNSETSTVRGLNKIIRQTAKNIGVKGAERKKISELQKYQKQFFQIYEKVQQYLDTANGSRFDYNKVWEDMNVAIKKLKIMEKKEEDIEKLSKQVLDKMEQLNKEQAKKKPKSFLNTGFYKPNKRKK